MIKVYAGVAEELHAFVFTVAHQPYSGLGPLIVEVSKPHTDLHTRWFSYERVISSSQRPLPTQHTTNTTDEHPSPKWDPNPQS